MIVMEQYAAPQFKPSTLRNDLSSTYPGLRLRDKGITFQELFIQNPDWRDMSFKSFFGALRLHGSCVRAGTIIRR